MCTRLLNIVKKKKEGNGYRTSDKREPLECTRPFSSEIKSYLKYGNNYNDLTEVFNK